MNLQRHINHTANHWSESKGSYYTAESKESYFTGSQQKPRVIKLIGNM